MADRTRDRMEYKIHVAVQNGSASRVRRDRFRFDRWFYAVVRRLTTVSSQAAFRFTPAAWIRRRTSRLRSQTTQGERAFLISLLALHIAWFDDGRRHSKMKSVFFSTGKRSSVASAAPRAHSAQAGAFISSLGQGENSLCQGPSKAGSPPACPSWPKWPIHCAN